VSNGSVGIASCRRTALVFGRAAIRLDCRTGAWWAGYTKRRQASSAARINQRLRLAALNHCDYLVGKSVVPQPKTAQANKDNFAGISPLAVFVDPPPRSDFLQEISGVMIAFAFNVRRAMD
jgi:hypothetical protein